MGYITLNNFPSIGDTCSQIQQYASLLGIAEKTGMEAVMLMGVAGKWGNKFDKVLDLDIKWIDKNDFEWEMKKINGRIPLDEAVFNLDKNKNYIFHSMFHIHTYWDNIRDYVYETFKYKQDVLEKANEYIKSLNLSKEKKLVSIHNRRGDYVQVASLNLNRNYYHNALTENFFSKDDVDDYVFLICTQDRNWFKANIWDEESDRVIFVETGNDFVDMAVMSLCDHNIIANSSYSWWAAFLNRHEDKIIVCPDDYLGAGIVEYINENYSLENWIRTKTK